MDVVELPETTRMKRVLVYARDFKDSGVQPSSSFSKKKHIIPEDPYCCPKIAG